jgi:soluble lytic murein transglycosylase-like protein
MGNFLNAVIFCSLVVCANSASASVRDILKQQYKQMAMTAAVDLALDPALLFAVISNESDWQARVLSPKGAMGLMQLMPETARNWGVTDPLNPKQNIYAGAKYLKHLLALFKNVSLAVAAYHAGEERTLKAGQVPDIPETQMYVRAVMETYRKLRFNSKNY